MVLLGSRVKIVIKSGWKNPMTGEEEDDDWAKSVLQAASHDV